MLLLKSLSEFSSFCKIKIGDFHLCGLIVQSEFKKSHLWVVGTEKWKPGNDSFGRVSGYLGTRIPDPALGHTVKAWEYPTYIQLLLRDCMLLLASVIGTDHSS